MTGVIPRSIARKLPAMVVTALTKMEPQYQEEFLEEYRRRRRGLFVAWLAWLFFGFHYIYQRRWGMQLLFWLCAGGLGVWWLIDFFRMPGVIDNLNRDLAVNILRDQKVIIGS